MKGHPFMGAFFLVFRLQKIDYRQQIYKTDVRFLLMEYKIKRNIIVVGPCNGLKLDRTIRNLCH